MPEGFSASYVVRDSNNQVVSDITTAGKHRLKTGTYTVTETISAEGSHTGLNVSESDRTVTVTIPEEGIDTAEFTSTYTKKKAHVQVIEYSYDAEQSTIDGYFDQDSDISVILHRPDHGDCHIYSRIGSPNAEATELDFTPSGGYLKDGTNRSYTFHVPAGADNYTIYITYQNWSADDIWPVSISQLSGRGIPDTADPNADPLMMMGIKSSDSAASDVFGQIGLKGLRLFGGSLRASENLIEIPLVNQGQPLVSTIAGKKYVVDDNWECTKTLTGPDWTVTVTQNDMTGGQYLAEKDGDGYDYLYFIESATEHNMLPGTEGAIVLNGDNVLTTNGETPLTLSNVGPVKHFTDLELDKSWVNGDRNATAQEVAEYAVTFEVFQKEITAAPTSILINDDGTDTGWNSVGQFKVTSDGHGEIVDGSFEAEFDAWQAVVKNLPENVIYATASNNKYYQYKVREIKVEKNGNDVTSDFIPSSNVQNKTVTIENDLSIGAIEITKNVLFDGRQADSDAQKALLNGNYKFEVKDSTGALIQGNPFAVTVSNGISGTCLIPDLKTGTYTITEIESNGLTLTGASGGNSVSQDVVTVTVTAGKTTSESLLDTAKAAFTNNVPTTEITVNKTWLIGSTDYKNSLSDMFGDVTVEVEVVKVADNAEDSDIKSALVAKNVFSEDAIGTLNAPSWTAMIRDLPELESGYVYAVREKKVKSGENDISTYFTISGEGIVAEGAITINNEPETVEVDVTKVWKPEIPGGATVTLSLYKGKTASIANSKVTDIVLDGEVDASAAPVDASNAAAGTKQEDTAWHAAFSNLPKYAYDSTDGIYEISYVVKEDTVPEGFSVAYTGGNTYALKGEAVTNTKLPGVLELKKEVTGEGADPDQAFEFSINLTAPSGETLAESYSFMKNGQPVAAAYTRGNDNTTAAVTGISLKHNDIFTIEDLPAGTVYEITENDYSGIGFSTTTSGAEMNGGRTAGGTISGGTVQKNTVNYTNDFSAGNLIVEKATSGNAKGGDDEFGFRVVLSKAGIADGTHGYYKIGTASTVDEAEESHEVRFADGTATIEFSLKDGEQAKFSFLPVGTYFEVTETVADQNGYETTAKLNSGDDDPDKIISGTITATQSMTASYLNSKNTTTTEAAKEWKIGNQSISWPEDVSKVVFTLYAKIGEAEPLPVNNEGISGLFTGIQPVQEITKDTVDHKAEWTNLPEKVLIPAVAADPDHNIEARAAEWKPVIYSVKETRIIYTNETEEEIDVPAADGVITNEVDTVQIHAAKKWKNKNGDELDGTEGREIPTGAQVTFTLVKDGTEDPNRTVVVNGVDETKNPDSGEEVTPQSKDYEGADWTAWFTELPKYNDDGTLVSYSVKEIGTWTGYEVDGQNAVSDAETITNKESSIDIHILKVDKQNNKPLTGATFVLKRYNEGYHEVLETWNAQEVSAEEGKKGTLTFEKLQIGSYELEEVIPPAGYIKTSSNPRFTVTADQNGNLIVTFENGDLITYDTTDKTFTVKNTPGAALPNTGGPGTDLYFSLGMLMLFLAGGGALMLSRRKIVLR